MARKKAPEKHANHERWLVSYGDFLTLLFAVFVALYAMGQTDKKKSEELVSSLRESFGYTKMSYHQERPSVLDNAPLISVPSLKPQVLMPGQGKNQNYPSRGSRNQMVATNKVQVSTFRDGLLAKINTLSPHTGSKVEVAVMQRGVGISINEAGFFEPASAELSKRGYQLLDIVATELSKYDNAIRVEGHTDDGVMKSAKYPSNWELSALRATNVVRFLVEQYLFDPEYISAVAFAQFRPLVPNDTPASKARNRRVDIILLARQDGIDGTPPGRVHADSRLPGATPLAQPLSSPTSSASLPPVTPVAQPAAPHASALPGSTTKH